MIQVPEQQPRLRSGEIFRIEVLSEPPGLEKHVNSRGVGRSKTGSMLWCHTASKICLFVMVVTLTHIFKLSCIVCRLMYKPQCGIICSHKPTCRAVYSEVMQEVIHTGMHACLSGHTHTCNVEHMHTLTTHTHIPGVCVCFVYHRVRERERVRVFVSVSLSVSLSVHVSHVSVGSVWCVCVFTRTD